MLAHKLDQAPELCGGRRLGCVESDLQSLARSNRIQKVEIKVAAAEEQPPHFQAILARSEKQHDREGVLRGLFPGLWHY
jgi:hypothetical protein